VHQLLNKNFDIPLEIRMDFEERCCGGVDWIYLDWDMEK
jgi:hypothetical protein